MGKNMGDGKAVQRIKEKLEYVDSQWKGADEKNRW